MSGFDFEDAVETVLERLGYDAEAQARTADMGRDVIARSDDETLVVECKHTKSSISRPDVQKLHSAAMSFDGRNVRAMLVSTGGFTGPAEDYADDIDEPVELWDYGRLVEHARAVDVYFTSDEQGTDYVFRGPERSTDQLRATFREAFVEQLESEPRPVDRVVDVHEDGREYVPAVLVEYDLDRQFGTSAYPNLYRARDRGRHLIPLEDVPDRERDLWSSTSFSVTCSGEVDGRPPSAYFGVDLQTFEGRIQRRLAREHSTTVHYTGRNNQDYSKECGVEPDDVDTRCRQVLLCRQYVRMGAGPEDYHFAVGGHREQPATIVESYGVDRDAATRIRREGGILCNDCGALEPERAYPPPETCNACGRTLCHRHHWDYPSKWPFHRPSRCASCYRTDADEDATLSRAPLGPLAMACVGPLLPGMSWALAGRLLGGMLWLMPFAVMLASVAYFGPTSGYGDESLIAAASIWGLHFVMVLHWAMRLRTHERNLRDEGLADYEPDWS